MDGVPGHERAVLDPGVLYSACGDHTHHHAGLVPDSYAAWVRPHMVRCGHDLEHGDGSDHPAGGPKPLRSTGHSPRHSGARYPRGLHTLRGGPCAWDNTPVLLPRPGAMVAESYVRRVTAANGISGLL